MGIVIDLAIDEPIWGTIISCLTGGEVVDRSPQVVPKRNLGSQHVLLQQGVSIGRHEELDTCACLNNGL